MTRRAPYRTNATPAHLASLPDAPQRPPRRYSQAELRQRRRNGLTTAHYDGTWSLEQEIAAAVIPLAERISAAHRPARFGHPTFPSVPWLLEAIHECVGVAVGWVAEGHALRKTKHLADEPGKRKYAVTTYVDLAPRPALPQITDEELEDGSWARKAIAMASAIDAEFSEMLARGYPPGAPGLRGQESRSERLDALLRRTLDHATLAITQRLDRDAHRDHHTKATPTDPRAALAALGVQTDDN
ncbi:hypothetical protein [Mycobacterium persicum]|uniref:hypothetical protein n=1 Tax=Mycobacterium persicum TaxID=1487726 RepID=UPI0009F2A64A|nr:hypothetical protein [Mycobacterium persicum]ORB32796.1 hypothetical protein BST40_27505 [Mycobacterium persicum]